VQFGAQGFTVAGARCNLIPQKDPELEDGTKCPSSSDCPPRSDYGSYRQFDWEWYSYAGGVSSILGTYPDDTDSYSCFKRAEVDACKSYPCQNSGSCTDVPNGASDATGRTCACSVGFTGDSCENEVESALSGFELVGTGKCAISTSCDDFECTNSFFYRHTDSEHYATNTHKCAREAEEFGAQGFYVNDNGHQCNLIPQNDPGLDDGAKCPSVSACPPRSPYGSYNQYDWEWYSFSGGVSPILGVYPTSSFSCYKKETKTALAEFELVGSGKCAISTNCNDWACANSFFSRYTESAHTSTNTEDCAQEAVQFGAQGFTVAGARCNLIPQKDPELEDGTKCPSSSDCPPRSDYGSYRQFDWEWYSHAGGVSPILGTYPDDSDSYSCYKRVEPLFSSCKAVNKYFKRNGDELDDACNSVSGCRVKKNKCKKSKCSKLSAELCPNTCRIVSKKSGKRKCKKK